MRGPCLGSRVPYNLRPRVGAWQRLDAYGIFCRFQGAPLDLHTPHFYAARKRSLDARLAALAAAPPSRLAEMVREAHEAYYGQASAFVRWAEDRYAVPLPRTLTLTLTLIPMLALSLLPT